MSAKMDCDYVVVGSGAGGGTVAARLAEAGYSVVVLEAGGDPRQQAQTSGGRSAPEDYDVPMFHPFASENETFKWDFFVRHYADQQVQRKDPKYREIHGGRRVDGVLYPRAGTLGGCTAHNAMIFVCPHNDDWNQIAELTGDASWRAEEMRAHFQKVESCRHRWPYRLLSSIGIDPTRHGWKGWLQTEKSIPQDAMRDGDLLETLAGCAHEAFKEIGHPLGQLASLLQSQLDPNDWRVVKQSAEGIRYMPLATRDHARAGTRERLLDVQRRFPGRLRIVLNALATRILFDGQRAAGVEYLHGERLYRTPGQPGGDGIRRQVHASREVIVAGGAFNTPQLLMLSGIGPAEELRPHGIEVRVDLAGVGRNLQDRYEIAVVNRMSFDEWPVLKGAEFKVGDPLHQRWKGQRDGVYATNGSALAVVKRSAPERPLPDLLMLAFLGRFEGYFPGYSESMPRERNYLTWTILKAHTNNRAGQVTLRSRDPRDTPLINFRYFGEGTPDANEDLDSVVEGVKFVRRIAKKLGAQNLVDAEEVPGDAVSSDEDLREFIRTRAWGHHASCTCAIGPRDRGGVLDSDFKVHGVTGLRVVDASVFPKIPGFFIASAIYTVGEKAAGVILAEAARHRGTGKASVP